MPKKLTRVLETEPKIKRARGIFESMNKTSSQAYNCPNCGSSAISQTGMPEIVSECEIHSYAMCDMCGLHWLERFAYVSTNLDSLYFREQ